MKGGWLAWTTCCRTPVQSTSASPKSKFHLIAAPTSSLESGWWCLRFGGNWGKCFVVVVAGFKPRQKKGTTIQIPVSCYRGCRRIWHRHRPDPVSACAWHKFDMNPQWMVKLYWCFLRRFHNVTERFKEWLSYLDFSWIVQSVDYLES